MPRRSFDQRGSVLVIAVIAMLVLGVLGVSFALLGRLEVATGLHQTAEVQAEALAEAGLARGRDAVRSAAAEPCGFTRWTEAGSAAHGCGPAIPGPLIGGAALGAGEYSAVLDNDCHPLVPPWMEDASCRSGAPGRDTNGTAVLTAWATAADGRGRARVRALVVIDTPWKHVCASSAGDEPPGHCNEPGHRNGTPVVTPADPHEFPGGPAAYDDLPRPQLGCSAVDPGVHGESPASCPPGQSWGPPYPGGKRLVVAGDRRLAHCDGGGLPYQGYFDCALTTPCPPAICGGVGRAACVHAGDARIDGVRYVSSAGGCGAHTGMVFRGASPPAAAYGAPGAGVSVYVMRGTAPPWTDAGCCPLALVGGALHGTAVVEGNGLAGCGGPGGDLRHANGARASAEPGVYGYPVVFLVFDPVEAVAEAPEPTASPLDPQETCAEVGGGAGTEVHGLIYSGGAVELGTGQVDGGVVAFTIQASGAPSTLAYNADHGRAAPPPGFPAGAGQAVRLLGKTFVACTNYAADVGGGSPCP